MKKNFAKVLCVLMSVLICAGMLAGCGNTDKDATDTDGEGKLSVVCTIFPQYDWVREILGDELNNVELTLLLDSGTDLHSYQPTAMDLIKITSADLFIYIGGESDAWVDDALGTAGGEVNTLNLMEALGNSAKVENDEGIVEESEEHEEGEEEVEYDEHIWLSLKNAVVLCNAIEEALAEIDSANAETYALNCTNYTEKLNALDKKFADTVANAKVNTAVCADRFPFRYLFEDYSINYFAAFSGCSAESEASFETVVSLANKVDEYSLKYVFQTENPLADIASTVIENTNDKNQKILTLDSLQSVTAEKVSEGKTYLGTMEQNINALTEGLEG